MLTGAMRPQKFVDTDADVNLGLAIAAVQTMSNGVFVCMHGLVLSYDQIDRDKKTGKYIKKTDK